MRMWSALVLALVATFNIAPQVVSACGDKFLLVGRGVRFQRAYAAIHPASILIVLPPKSVKAAAVRDSRLATALKMAGHQVETVQQPANIAGLLERSRIDLVLAERADASAIRNAGGGNGQKQPTVIGVLEEPSASELAAARQQVEYVLKTPQSLPQILSLLDDIMKARLDAMRRPG